MRVGGYDPKQHGEVCGSDQQWGAQVCWLGRNALQDPIGHRGSGGAHWARDHRITTTRNHGRNGLAQIASQCIQRRVSPPILTRSSLPAKRHNMSSEPPLPIASRISTFMALANAQYCDASALPHSGVNEASRWAESSPKCVHFVTFPRELRVIVALVPPP
jgi:hypothetical protein